MPGIKGMKSGKRICPKKRFYSNVLIPNEKGCMEWVGRKNKGGYGSFLINRKCVSVHRFSYELHFGNIEKNKFVLHKCDNPSCVAPNHLFLGTQKDNIIDMINKGRNPNNYIFLKNAKVHSRAKLNESEVREIREMVKKGIKQTIIAKLFNISKVNISHIKTNYSWKKLK